MNLGGAEAWAGHPEIGLLMIAVPMEIARVREMSEDARGRLAGECSQYIAEHGDNLLYKSDDREHSTARAFNTLATGLAVAAFAPGGVTFAGMHFCTDHEACVRAWRKT